MRAEELADQGERVESTAGRLGNGCLGIEGQPSPRGLDRVNLTLGPDSKRLGCLIAKGLAEPLNGLILGEPPDVHSEDGRSTRNARADQQHRQQVDHDKRAKATESEQDQWTAILDVIGLTALISHADDPSSRDDVNGLLMVSDAATYCCSRNAPPQ